MTEPAGVRAFQEEGGAVVRLVFSHGKGNILDRALVAKLRAAVREAARPGVKALILEGEGAHFSYGASVEEHLPDRVRAFLREFHELFRTLIEAAVPLLAVVRGQCLGGGLELASFCHRLFVAPDARLGQPEIRLAVFAPVASLVLPCRTTQRTADELLLTGRVVNAPEAVSLGLADELHEDPLQAAREFAGRLLPLSATSLRFAVRAARHGMHQAFLSGIEVLERLYLEELMDTADAGEGITAFLEKRAPGFAGTPEGRG